MQREKLPRDYKTNFSAFSFTFHLRDGIETLNTSVGFI